MEQNLVHANENALTKSNIASYVHDMMELEKEQFTLEQLNKKCIDERKRLEENSKRTLAARKNDCQQAKAKWDKALEQQSPKPTEIVKPAKVRKPFTGDFAPLFFPVYLAIITLIIYPFVPRSQWEPEPTPGLLILIIVPAILLHIMNYKIAKKRYDNYLIKQQQYDQYINSLSRYNQQEKIIENCQNQYALTQKNLEEAKKHCAEAQKQIEKLDHISKYLSLHISKIEAQKTKLYSLDIISFDYRKLDCLIEFDQMFRNDLVDTLREAKLIYEERVRHGELMTGIDNIYNMLGSLTAAMHNIESALYSIKNEVQLMSDDVYKIASSTEKFQDSMLSESRAARYATEALKKSTERCEWYMNRQYWRS